MKILMVCLGNICRSPLAEGIMRHKLQSSGLDFVEVDSSGTGGWHAGENPDPRSTAIARKYGIDISAQVARQFSPSDFDRFDRIFVMDTGNMHEVLKQVKNEGHKEKVSLILEAVAEGASVPDPYYGGDEGFDEVFNMLDKACDTILEELKVNG